MLKLLGLILTAGICLVFFACSSTKETTPEKKSSWWGKAKCKIMKKNEECE